MIQIRTERFARSVAPNLYGMQPVIGGRLVLAFSAARGGGSLPEFRYRSGSVPRKHHPCLLLPRRNRTLSLGSLVFLRGYESGRSAGRTVVELRHVLHHDEYLGRRGYPRI